MVSEKALAKVEKQNESLKARIKREAAKAKGAADAAIQTAASMGSAFGVSYVEGRYPDKKDLMGVPISLAVGVGASLAGVLGVGGDKTANSILTSVGTGALAAYAAARGLEMGQEAQ